MQFSPKTVYIVDRDLGFVFWLGHLLTEVGYEAMPARASADAVELLRIMEILPDLMIVCPRVPGSSELVQHFRRISPLMKVIVAVDALEDAGQFTAAADICCVKPNHYDDVSGLEWVDLADRILHSRVERCPTPCLT